MPREEENVKLRALGHPAISSEEEFVHHSPLFFRIMTSLLQHDKFLLEFQRLWTRLVAMVIEVMKSEGVQRKNVRDILSNCLDLCHSLMKSGLATTDKLRLIGDVVDFPSDVLISTVHGDKSLTGVEVLTTVILTEEILTSGSDEDVEKIIECMPKLIACCFHDISPLRHIRFVYDVVTQAAHCLRSDQLFRLWLSTAMPLNDYIIRSNDINEGTSLEPDFTTCYNLVLFPFRHLIDISQEMRRALVKSWAGLYRTITNAAALVTNLQPNQCVEDVSFSLLKLFGENGRLRNGSLVCVLAECLRVVITHVDYGVLLKRQAESSGENVLCSPSKWSKTRKSSGSGAGSMTCLVRLVGVVLGEALRDKENGQVMIFHRVSVGRPKKCCLNDLTICVVIDALSNLFTHLNGAGIVCVVLKELASSVSRLLKKSFSDKQMMSKVTLLCSHVLTCVQRGHGGPYDIRLLEVLSPYLEEMLCHSKKQIRNQTAIFWNATFGKSEYLEYPSSLKPKLSCLKAKMPIVLPGWTDDVQTNDTQGENSMNADDASQMAVTNDITSCISSPSRLKGSFLHKASETERILVQASPIKEALRRSVRRKEATRRKLQLFDEKESVREDEFVVVGPMMKKRRLLTEHQKEVMREKKARSV